MTVATEAQQLRDLLEQVAQIEEVAETLPVDDQRRQKLEAVAEKQLASAAPVRPVVASKLLQLTEKTVRAWADEGVLVVHQKRPRVLLDARRLHHVLHLLTDLRRAGKTRGLLDEVYRQLSDQALLDREDLSVSLDQMRRHEGRIVRPRPRDINRDS
jgi:hypothetical protein